MMRQVQVVPAAERTNIILYNVFTSDQRRIVLKYLRTGIRIKAIAAIRQFKGMSLKQAVEALYLFERATSPAELYAENHVGMTADVLAIGPFSIAIVDHMEYPPQFYADAREGVTVIQVLFECYEGSSRSRALAACFDIDAWDFNRHELDARSADVGKLREMFGEEEVGRFETLRKAGFKFYYRPNG